MLTRNRTPMDKVYTLFVQDFPDVAQPYRHCTKPFQFQFGSDPQDRVDIGLVQNPFGSDPEDRVHIGFVQSNFGNIQQGI